VDLTHDPKGGVDCADLFERLKADDRVLYLIFNRRIWVKGDGEKKYSGANPHTGHLHISLKKEKSKDTSAWFPWATKPKKTPITVTKTAIAKIQKPKKKLPKTKNEKLRSKSLLASLFKRGKK
ncbi:MAG: hypothetical protein ACO3E4_08145, partial [Candidatus Nanopelagicaceae bacterium]